MWVTYSTVLADRSTSTAHLRNSMCGDSAAAWKDDYLLALVVADGVGSTSHGADASRLAVALTQVKLATKGVLFHGARQSDVERLSILYDIVAEVQAAFHDTIANVPDTDQWKTTFAIGILLTPPASGGDSGPAPEALLLAVSLGDSILFCGTDDSCQAPLLPVILPKRLQVGDPLDRPMTLHDSLNQGTAVVVRLRHLESVLLTTDGLEKLVEVTEPSEIRVASESRELVEYVRSQQSHLLDAVLAQGLSVKHAKLDDKGVAVAAWR